MPNTLNIQNYKARLRKIFLAKRINLAQTQATIMSTLACQRLMASRFWIEAQTICLYMPIKAEIDPSLLWSKDKKILLPRCQAEQGIMDFVECSPSDLVLGKYNILEAPCKLKSSELIPDIILVPALIYDRHGYRIGYGGGYYDRILAQEKYANSLSIGLAYDFQLCSKLLHEKHDIALKVLSTNSELIIF